jgi:hypothetical protein
VTQLALKPGQMTSTLPLAPFMAFVHGEAPTLVSTFPQNVIGDETWSGSGGGVQGPFGQDLQGDGQPLTANHGRRPVDYCRPAAHGHLGRRAEPHFGRVRIRCRYRATLDLLGGAQATTAIYTEHVHVLATIRKIILRIKILRIKSWENYLFLP